MSKTTTFVFCGMSLLIGITAGSQKPTFADTRDIVYDLYVNLNRGENTFDEVLQADNHAVYEDLYERDVRSTKRPVIPAEKSAGDTDLFGVMRGDNKGTTSAKQSLPPDTTNDLYGILKDGRNFFEHGLRTVQPGASDDLYCRDASIFETSISFVEKKARDTDLFGVIRGKNTESTAAGSPLPPDQANDLYGTLIDGKNESQAHDQL
jgi:hypothetical protein